MNTMDKSEITQLLLKASKGKEDAYEKLFPLVYDELKRIARIQLNREYGNHTLSKTELVHEVYLKLIDQTRIDWKDRTHFYAISARSMRQILVDHARKKKAQKRGGDKTHVSLEEDEIDIRKHAEQIVELDELLKQLADLDERMAKTVELRFFGGMSIEETAEFLEISTSTVDRDWQKARGWLYQRLRSKSSTR